MLVYYSTDLVQVSYTDFELQDDKDLEVYIWIIVYTWWWVITWRSIEQSCITNSTMAEYVSTFKVAKNDTYISNADIVIPTSSQPLTLYRDNSGTMKIAKEPRSRDRSKYI